MTLCWPEPEDENAFDTLIWISSGEHLSYAYLIFFTNVNLMNLQVKSFYFMTPAIAYIR